MGDTKAVKTIWERTIETILNWCKRDLVEYIDLMIENGCRDAREKDRLIKIKKRVHQNCSSAQLQLITMLLVKDQGGSIEPFENLLRPEFPQVQGTYRQGQARDAAEALLPTR